MTRLSSTWVIAVPLEAFELNSELKHEFSTERETDSMFKPFSLMDDASRIFSCVTIHAEVERDVWFKIRYFLLILIKYRFFDFIQESHNTYQALLQTYFLSITSFTLFCI